MSKISMSEVSGLLETIEHLERRVAALEVKPARDSRLDPIGPGARVRDEWPWTQEKLDALRKELNKDEPFDPEHVALNALMKWCTCKDTGDSANCPVHGQQP